MLITTCAHCHARFRVTPQQLNVKQGQVRCGKCGQVFSGFQSLVRVPDDDTGTRLLAAREAREREEASLHVHAEPPSAIDLPLEPPVTMEPPPAPETEVPSSSPIDPGTVQAEAPVRTLRRRSPWAPELSLETTPHARRVARAWSFGVALLTLVFLAEIAYGYRSTLAQRYPPLRPLLEAACAQLDCAVPWARDPNALKLEESDLLEVPGRPGEIALSARVRNLGTEVQEYPHLELTLTDLGGQVAARRVLRPVDYLGRPIAATDVLQPGNEILLQLRLEVPRLKATGYELLLFYP